MIPWKPFLAMIVPYTKPDKPPGKPPKPVDGLLDFSIPDQSGLLALFEDI